MNELPFVSPAPVFIEINQASLKAVQGNAGAEIPLERLENGRLSPACQERIITRLRAFLARKYWQPRVRAYCAIEARGVSLRQLALPASAPDEFHRVLLLQVEAAFPLPPDELAWGWRRIESRPADGAPGKQQVLVAAVKREALEDYSRVLAASGAHPVFTLAALARSKLGPASLDSCAMLDVGRNHSELLVLERGIPVMVRLLPISAPDPSVAGNGTEFFAQTLGSVWTGSKLYLTGEEDVPGRITDLAERLGHRLICQHVPSPTGPGRSAAILGLQKSVEESNGSLPLTFHSSSRPMNGSFGFSDPAPKRFLKPAALLLACAVILPYLEVLVFKPILSHKLATIKANRGRLSTIDAEFSFFQFLKQNQPPYLDALYLFANAAPSGARIETLSMNRRGEVSLHASLLNARQVAEFRSKMIDSGFFSSVSIEEQAPTPDRQKIRVRIGAQWKPLASRAVPALMPAAAQPSTNAPNPKPTLSAPPVPGARTNTAHPETPTP